MEAILALLIPFLLMAFFIILINAPKYFESKRRKYFLENAKSYEFSILGFTKKKDLQTGQLYTYEINMVVIEYRINGKVYKNEVSTMSIEDLAVGEKGVLYAFEENPYTVFVDKVNNVPFYHYYL